jgi:putative hemolysin
MVVRGEGVAERGDTDGQSAHLMGKTERLPMLAIPTLWRLYRQAQRRSEPSFSDRALAVLGISYESHGELDDIPAAGPTLVVANHPFGALDGLVFASLLARRRPDVRLLANNVLGLLPGVRDQLLLVNVFGGRTVTAKNVTPMRTAIRWMRDAGGCLCVFPAGVVSHEQTGVEGVIDPVWHESVARMARMTGAVVVPCFIEGQNSRLFQRAARIHPFLRTLLLPRELLRARGGQVQVHIGRAIPAAQLDSRDDRATAAGLRHRVYALAPERRGAVKREVAALPPDQTLVRAEPWSVFFARAAQAPALMQEIGREREVAFRGVKEGTGHEIDLDAFDRRYLHLCLWDHNRDELAGAYRMHPVEAWSGGQEGELYTQTLFRFDRRLTAALAPAIELGRAFVRPAYQKHHAALALLWAGIARFVARHPRYRHLFGAVSIGSTYSPPARQLMVDYLRRHAYHHQLASLVAAHNPPEDGEMGGAQAEDVPPPMPVLLRQYLKLQARVLGFNIDPAFGHALDALVVVDLTQVPTSVLGRYMGRDAAREYLAYHRIKPVTPLAEELPCRRSA